MACKAFLLRKKMLSGFLVTVQGSERLYYEMLRPLLDKLSGEADKALADGNNFLVRSLAPSLVLGRTLIWM
jgi:hypothetical protein